MNHVRPNTPELSENGISEEREIEKAAKLISRLRKAIFVFNMAKGDGRSPTGQHKRLLNSARVINQVAEGGDEHHSLEELYRYRMLYHAHAAYGWYMTGISVYKSWRHSDGELCFGGGWFIVVAELPTGQVSNHYKAEFWPLFNVPDSVFPPAYDGHTPTQAAGRLEAYLLMDGRGRHGK